MFTKLSRIAGSFGINGGSSCGILLHFPCHEIIQCSQRVVQLEEVAAAAHGAVGLTAALAAADGAHVLDQIAGRASGTAAPHPDPRPPVPCPGGYWSTNSHPSPAESPTPPAEAGDAASGELVVILEHLDLAAVVVEHGGQSPLEALFVHAALGSVDVVGEGEDRLVIAVVILHGHFRHGVLSGSGGEAAAAPGTEGLGGAFFGL